MKKLILTLLVMVGGLAASSQDMTKFNLYKPEDNAKKEIESAVKKAKELVYLVCKVQCFCYR